MDGGKLFDVLVRKCYGKVEERRLYGDNTFLLQSEGCDCDGVTRLRLFHKGTSALVPRNGWQGGWKFSVLL